MIARILAHMDATDNTRRSSQSSEPGDHHMHDTLQRLFRHKAWANDELLTALARLGPEDPITKLAVKALSHSYVVDRIFAAHMHRNVHTYTSTNLSEMP